MNILDTKVLNKNIKSDDSNILPKSHTRIEHKMMERKIQIAKMITSYSDVRYLLEGYLPIQFML